MTFVSGLNDWAARHENCRQLGYKALDLQFINLIDVARQAAEHGGDITDKASPWGQAYHACLEANATIRKAAYAVGYELSDDKPPMHGPAIMLT